MPDPALVPSPLPARAQARSGLLRRALSWTFRRIIGIYFRAIETTGSTPTGDTGGRLFVSNHVNALVDPILVLTSAPCPISPVAKSTLWKIPGLRWLLDAVDAVPIVRRRDDPTKVGGSGGNEEVFDRIAAWLAGGQNILIFPEGTSHSEPHLITVRTGPARMLARAKAIGGRGLTLQAVALEFDERHVFRSRCLMLYGPVREVDSFVEEGEALVTALTERLREDLSELLVEGATWPERLLIARVAEMLANDTGDRSLLRWNSIGREVEAARKALREGDDEAVARIDAAVNRYYELLAQEGLDDTQLALGEAPRGSLLSAVALVLLLPLAAIGIVLYALPYRIPSLVAKRAAANEADVISTYKLGAGILVYPIWAGMLIALAVVLLPGWLAAVSSVLVLLSPFAALAWLDRTPALRRSLRLRARAAMLAELREARGAAMRLVEETRGALGM